MTASWIAFAPSLATLVLLGVTTGCSSASSSANESSDEGVSGNEAVGAASAGDSGISSDSGPIVASSGTRATCSNGRQDPNESAVDCGGVCTKCADGQTCNDAADCSDGVCGTSGTCSPPSCTDGVQNGSEADVDCGGSCPSACAAGKTCATGTDCTRGACDYSGHCAAAPSCTQHHGGDTCGPGADGDPNGQFESCCTSLPITGGDSTELDKFVLTAGRMRAFVDAVGGNVRGFTQAIPATNPWWNHAWDAYVPSTTDEVDLQLGPYPAPLSPDPVQPNNADGTANPQFNGFGQWRHGCSMGEGGARTWWTPGTIPSDTAPMNYSQDVLDEKPIDCVDAYFLTALCIYDGGHLATGDDLAAAWGNGPYPWSDRVGGADEPFDYLGTPTQVLNGTTYAPCSTDLYPASANTNASCFNAHENYPFVQMGGTFTPTFDIAPFQDKIVREFGAQFDGPFTYTWPMDLAPATMLTDNSTHMAAPGRMPNGASASGHMDLAGLEFEMTAIMPSRPQPTVTTAYSMPSDASGAFDSGSWESHTVGYGKGKTVEQPLSNGAWWAYWAAGGRCAHGGNPP